MQVDEFVPITLSPPGYFNDFVRAIDRYPQANVQIKVEFWSYPGSVFNEQEIARFKVRVTNLGHLSLRNLRLHIHASQWTKVRKRLTVFPPFRAASSTDFERMMETPGLSAEGIERIPFPTIWSDQIMSESRDLLAHNTITFGWFEVKAMQHTNDQQKEIVRVHIYDFDADLSDILKGHVNHSTVPEDSITQEIHPV